MHISGSPENPWGVGLSIWETSPFSGFELARMRRRDSLSETCRINPEDKLLCQCCPKYNNNQGCTIFQILSFCASKTKQPRKWWSVAGSYVPTWNASLSSAITCQQDSNSEFYLYPKRRITCEIWLIAIHKFRPTLSLSSTEEDEV